MKSKFNYRIKKRKSDWIITFYEDFFNLLLKSDEKAVRVYLASLNKDLYDLSHKKILLDSAQEMILQNYINSFPQKEFSKRELRLISNWFISGVRCLDETDDKMRLAVFNLFYKMLNKEQLSNEP